jgi:hypothetical protein
VNCWLQRGQGIVALCLLYQLGVIDEERFTIIHIGYTRFEA